MRVCNRCSNPSHQPWKGAELWSLPHAQKLLRGTTRAELFPVFGNLGTRLGRTLVSQKSLTGGLPGPTTLSICAPSLPGGDPASMSWHLLESHLGVLQTQAREGGCPWLQTTSPSNSANPNKIGKRQWEEMIVSWLFSERKQKKNANRSTPCILVQNLRVLGKEPVVLASCPLTRCLGGAPGLGWRAWAAFPPWEREVRGLGRSLEDPSYQGRRCQGLFVLWADRDPPFGGGGASGEVGNSGADACKAQWRV